MIRPRDTRHVFVCLIVLGVAFAPLATGAAAGPFPGSAAADVDADVEGSMMLAVVDETDDTVTVELSTDVNDVAGYHVNIYYDEEVATIENITGGEGVFDSNPVQNIDAENGSAAFNHANPPSEAEDAPTLAKITFSVPDGQAEIAFDIDSADPVVDSHLGLATTETVFDLAKEPIVIGEDDGDDPAPPSPPEDPGDSPDDDPGDGPSDVPTDVPGNITADVTLFENGVTMSTNNVSAGDTVAAVFEDLSDGSTAVSGVSLEMATDANRVGLDTELLPDRPADVSDLSGSEPVTYIEFTPDGFESGDLASASVSFEVSEDALPNEADGDDVRLYRYVNDRWETLETTHEGDNTYVAETPGFSTFVVGVEQADLSVIDASISTDTVNIGESVTVEATVENTGDTDGEAIVTLRADGGIAEERTITVSANGQTTATFSFSSDDAGDYTLAVDDVDAGTLSVSDGSIADEATSDDAADGGDAIDNTGDTFEQFGGSPAVLIVLVVLATLAAVGVALRQR